jgi:snurportin-1
MKLQEEKPECLRRDNVNPYIFRPLPTYSTDKGSLEKVFMDPDFPMFDGNLDGILFYHNMLNYMPGHTPLVGWLKGYMIPEMLGIAVSNKIESQKPPTYGSMKEHITDFETNYFQKKEQRKLNENKRDESMSEDCSSDISASKTDTIK